MFTPRAAGLSHSILGGGKLGTAGSGITRGARQRIRHSNEWQTHLPKAMSLGRKTFWRVHETDADVEFVGKTLVFVAYGGAAVAAEGANDARRLGEGFQISA